MNQRVGRTASVRVRKLRELGGSPVAGILGARDEMRTRKLKAIAQAVPRTRLQRVLKPSATITITRRRVLKAAPAPMRAPARRSVRVLKSPMAPAVKVHKFRVLKAPMPSVRLYRVLKATPVTTVRKYRVLKRAPVVEVVDAEPRKGRRGGVWVPARIPAAFLSIFVAILLLGQLLGIGFIAVNAGGPGTMSIDDDLVEVVDDVDDTFESMMVPEQPTPPEEPITAGEITISPASSGEGSPTVYYETQIPGSIHTSTRALPSSTLSVPVSSESSTPQTAESISKGTDAVRFADDVVDGYTPQIAVEKTGPDWAYFGEPLHYTYEVWSPTQTDLGQVAIWDSFGSPSYVSGDLDEDDVLDAGETWVLELWYSPTWLVPGGELSNMVYVSAYAMCGDAEPILVEAWDWWTLYGFIVKKDVVLFWDGFYVVQYDDPATEFWFILMNCEQESWELYVTESDPVYLWLSAGSWVLQECMQEGYVPADGFGSVEFVAGERGYWQFINIILFDLEVTKKGEIFAHEGDMINYTIQVENHGSAVIPGAFLKVVDSILGDISLLMVDPDGDGLLEPGEIWYCELEYEVPVPSDDITNEVDIWVEATTPWCTPIIIPDTNPENDHAEWTVDVLHPGLSIDKEASVEYAHEGDLVTYTITVENTGDCVLHVVVTDPMNPGGEQLYIGFIGAGSGPMSWSFNYPVTSDDPDVLENTATANGQDALGGEKGTVEVSDSDEVIVLRPEINVAKYAPSYVPEDEAIEYTYEVTNTGNCDLYDVDLTDIGLVPDVLHWPDMIEEEIPTEYVGGDDGDGVLEVGETWLYEGEYCGWFLGELKNTVTVTAEDITEHEVSDTDCEYMYGVIIRKDVVLYWDHGLVEYDDPYTEFTVDLWNSQEELIDTVTISESDPYMFWLAPGEYYFEEVDVPQGYVSAYGEVYMELPGTYPDWTNIDIILFDLSLVKEGPDYAHAGDTITYKLAVSNSGPASILGDMIVVWDDVCGYATYVAGDDNGNGALDPGEEWVFMASTTAGTEDITNTAYVAVWGPNEWYPTLGPEFIHVWDTNPENDCDSHFVDVLNPAILLTKVADKEVASVGEMITYTLTIYNVGDCGLTVVVTDTNFVIDGVIVEPFYLEPDDPPMTITYTHTASYLDPDVLENTATATGTDELGGPKGTVISSDKEDVTILKAKIAIEKEGPIWAYLGQPVTFYYHVSNPGGVPLSDVHVLDDKISGIVYVSGDADGDDLLDTDEVWLLQGVGVPGPWSPEPDEPFVNTATAFGTAPWDEVVTSEDYFVLYGLDIEKDVLLYFGDGVVRYSDPYTVFEIDIYVLVGLNDCGVYIHEYIGTVTVSESRPAYIWVAEGCYLLVESEWPEGYASILGYNMKLFCTGEDYGYALFINLISFNLAIDKEADREMAHEGDTVTYTYTLTNDGPASIPLAYIQVYDDVLGWITGWTGDSNADGKLNPGEVWVATKSMVVTAETPDVVTNTVTVSVVVGSVIISDMDSEDDSDSETVYVLRPGIAVDKVTPQWAYQTEGIWYTFYVTNTGNCPLRWVYVEDSLLEDDVWYVGGDDNDNGWLDLDETWVFEGVYRGPCQMTELENTATAHGWDALEKEVTATDTETMWCFVLGKDVVMYWDSMPWLAYDDDVGEFEFTLYDEYENELTTFWLMDGDRICFWLSEGTYWFVETWWPEGYSPTYDWIMYTTGQGWPDWTYMNIIHFDLALEKTGPDYAHVGDEITYTYRITNKGPAAVPGEYIYIDDPMVDNFYYVGGDMDGDWMLDIDETWWVESFFDVCVEAPDELVNCATVEVWCDGYDYTPMDRNLGDNTDCHTVLILRPSVTVSKTGPAMAHVGDTVTYTITVTNTGNCDIDIVVTDSRVGTLFSGTLGIGQVLPLTFSDIVPADEDPMENEVDVVGTDDLGGSAGSVSAHASWSIDVIKPGISLDKVAPEWAYERELVYTYYVENTGEDPLYNVQLVDDKVAVIKYLSGDTNENGILDPGEIWVFEGLYCGACQMTPLTNTAEVSALDVLDMTVSAEDSETVYCFTFRKDVVLYWDGYPWPGYDDPYGEFEFTVFNSDDEELLSFWLMDGESICIWFDDGEYYFVETWMPDGYSGSYDCVVFRTGEMYPDWVYLNIIHFDLALEKTGPEMAHVGDTIKYTYQVSNKGPAAVPGAYIVIEDDKVSGIVYVSGDTDGDGWLDVGEVWVFEATYEVKDSDGDHVTNCAEVKVVDEVAREYMDLNEIDNSACWTVDILRPGVSITKTGPEKAHVGDLVEYTIVVENTGNCDLTILVVDSRGGLLYFGTLAAGESLPLTFTDTVPSDEDPMLNTVSVEGEDDLGGAAGTVTAKADWDIDVVKPSILLDKVAPEWAYCGMLEYFYYVTNDGEDPLTDVSVVDDKVGEIRYVSGDDGDGILEVGETWVFAGVYNGGCQMTPLANTATVTAYDEIGGEVSSTDTETVYCLTIRKDVVMYWDSMPWLPYDDETGVFLFGLYNSEMELLVEFELMDGEHFCVWLDDGEYCIKELELPDGYNRSYEYITYETGEYPDWSYLNIIRFDLALEKTGPEYAHDGDEITYTFTVTNKGPASVPGEYIVIVDSLVSCVWYVSGDTDGDGMLDPDEAWVYEGTYIVSGEVPAPEELWNCAEVQVWAEVDGQLNDYTPMDLNRDDNSDCHMVFILRPEISIDKSSEQWSFASDGMTYTYVVTNTGNCPLYSVGVIDDKVSSISYVSGDDGDGVLEVGETWTFTGTHYGFANGELTNIATATGCDELQKEVSATDSTTVIGVTVRKDVLLYWDGYPWDGYTDPYTVFGVAMYDDDWEWLADFEISEMCPMYLWVSPGIYNFLEFDLPYGYEQAYANGYEFIAGEEYPDFSLINIIKSDLALEKSGPEMAYPGDEIVYSYTITNSGPAAVPGVWIVIVDDNAPTPAYVSGDTDGDGWLDVGEVWLFQVTFEIPEDFAGDWWDNYAEVSVVDDIGRTLEDLNTDDNSDEWSVFILHPALEITKDVSTSKAHAGDLVTYTITVENTGNCHLTLVVSDGMGMTWDAIELGPGEIWSQSYTVTLPDQDEVLNVAEATGTDPLEGTMTVTDDAYVDIIHGDIELDKVAPLWSYSCTLRYEYYVRLGDGSDPLGSVTVVDDKVDNIVYISGDDDDDLLEQGETWLYYGYYDGGCILGPEENGWGMTNTATATGYDEIQGKYTSTDQATMYCFTLRKEVMLYWDTITWLNYEDPYTVFFVDVYVLIDDQWVLLTTDMPLGISELNPLCIWLSAGVYWFVETLLPDGYTAAYEHGFTVVMGEDYPDWTMINIIHFDLAIEKYGPEKPVYPGEEIVYEYHVTTYGPAAISASYVVVTDDKVGDIEFAYELIGDGDGYLEEGEVWVFYGYYTVPEDYAGDWLHNCAFVSLIAYGVNYTFMDTYLENNKDCCEVFVLHPSVEITKVGSTALAHPGDLVTYTITVTNTGNCPLSVVITDDDLGMTWGPFDLDPSDSWSATFTATMPQMDFFINTAEVSGEDPREGTVYDSDDWCVELLNPAIEIDKEVSPDEGYVGDTVVYTIIVRNTGDCTLYNITVDDFVIGLHMTIGSLGAGKSTTINHEYELQASDDDPLVNTATAEGEDKLHKWVSDSDQATVDILPAMQVYVTPSEFCCILNSFNIVFGTDCPCIPTYKMASTNPGTFYFNVLFKAPYDGPLWLTYNLDYFVTKGANPLHVYLVPDEVYEDLGPGEFITPYTAGIVDITGALSHIALGPHYGQAQINGVEEGDIIYVALHVVWELTGTGGYTLLEALAFDSEGVALYKFEARIGSHSPMVTALASTVSLPAV